MREDLPQLFNNLRQQMDNGTLPMSPNYYPVVRYLISLAEDSNKWFDFNVPNEYVGSLVGQTPHTVYYAVKRLCKLSILYESGKNQYGKTYRWTLYEENTMDFKKIRRPPNSDVTGPILSALPGTLAEIATRSGIHQRSVSRIVAKLAANGIVTTARVGNTKQVNFK